MFGEEDYCGAAAPETVENAIRAEDQSGRVATDHAIAPVVREEPGEDQRIRRAFPRRQS